MFSVIRPLTKEEAIWALRYYQNLHGEEFDIPPKELDTAELFLDYFNVLREEPKEHEDYRSIAIACAAFGKRQLERLETGHFILSSIADVIGTHSSPAFLIGLLRTESSPLLICAILKPKKKNSKYVLALADFNPNSARFASPLWTPEPNDNPIPPPPYIPLPPLDLPSANPKTKKWWCRFLRA
jgi:hypothetical protein